MDFNRRLMVSSLAAAAGLGGCAALGAARNGRTPATAKDLDALVRARWSPGGAIPNGFACVRATQYAEGPFYYETSLQRRSIAEKRPGIPLRLGITLGGMAEGESNCFPLAGVVVDIWHADASGLYSNVGTDLQLENTIGQTFMRGHQVTDERGYVEFDTILPGWEVVAAVPGVPGAPPVLPIARTVHIHVKAFHGREVLTHQLFFEDSLLDQVFDEIEPYKSGRLMTVPRLDKPFSRIRNTEDFLFTRTKPQPLKAERVDGMLVAKASIGVLSVGDQGFRTLFR
ncbi:MAG TPA: hypothetical protein PLN33_02415 [Hyphomonadaceae bacterium]|nr:hypothetical protein [Hyphomonadaceae bacterium]